MPHRPPYTRARFVFDDVLDTSRAPEDRRYAVVSVDTVGRAAASPEVAVGV